MKRVNCIYEGFKINFLLFGNDRLMINATEMAKVFNKDIRDFMILKQTKDSINTCLKAKNSWLLDIENKDELYITKHKTGTWMHRFLAIKFAAWLDPVFEVWIILTLEKIIFDYYKEIEDANNEILMFKKLLQLKKQELMSKIPELSEQFDPEDKISTVNLKILNSLRCLFLN